MERPKPIIFWAIPLLLRLREIAGATQSWDALHVLPFADMKIRNLTVLRNAGRSITGHAYSRVATRGVHLAIAPRELTEPSDAPKPWKCELSNVGAFPDAHQDKAICFPEELPDASSASPPLRHFCARPPWCNRATAPGVANRFVRVVMAWLPHVETQPKWNSAPPRIIIAGELAGEWDR